MDDSSTELTSGFGQPVAPETPDSSPAIPAPRSPSPSPMMGHFGDLQDQAALRFQRMQEATSKLAVVRKELDGLTALGDMVTQDDVVKAASGLVAAGLGSVQVAGLLADMPDSGPALQAWVAQHDKQTQVREAQAQQALAVTRHQMGLTALRHLMGASAEGGPSPQPPSAPSNPLTLNGPSAQEASNAP